MPPVHTAPLPPHSALHQQFAPGDFLDCYAVASDLPVRQAADIIASFPGWAGALVRLRAVLTGPFGLQNGPPPGAEDCVGPFPVIAERDDELLAGFDDKHLNFIVSVCRHEGRIHLATWVRRHNVWGRAYLAAIMPFHILIARNALSRAGRAPVMAG